MLPPIAAFTGAHPAGRAGSSPSLAPPQDAAPATEVTRGSAPSAGAPGAPALAIRRLQPLATPIAVDLFERPLPVTLPPRRPNSAPSATPATPASARSAVAPLRRVCSTRHGPLHPPGSPRSGSSSDGESGSSTPESPSLLAPARPRAAPPWSGEIAHLLLSASARVQGAQSLRQQLEGLRQALSALLPQGLPAQRRARWDMLCRAADPAWADPAVHPGPGGRLKVAFACQAQALQLELLAGLLFTSRDDLLAEIGSTLIKTLRLVSAGQDPGPELELQGMRLRALYLQLPPDARRAKLRELEQLPFRETPPFQRMRALSILSLRIAERGAAATRRSLVDTATVDTLRGRPEARLAVHKAMIDLACPSGLPMDERYRLQRLCLDLAWPVAARTGPEKSVTQTGQVSAQLRLLMLEALARDGVARPPVLALPEAIHALAARTPAEVKDALRERLAQVETASPAPAPAPATSPAASGDRSQPEPRHGQGHQPGGQPAQDPQPRADDVRAHHRGPARDRHHHRHDGDRDDAIDHRDPEQLAHRVHRGEAKHQPAQGGRGDHRVERSALPVLQPQAQAALPAGGLGHGVGGGAGQHRDRQQAGGHDAQREQQEGVVAGHRPKRLGRLG